MQHVGVHDPVAERPLDKRGLALPVLMHEAAVNVQVGLARHSRFPERPPDHGLGGPLEVRLSLARHELLPLFSEQKQLPRFLVGRSLLFYRNHVGAFVFLQRKATILNKNKDQNIMANILPEVQPIVTSMPDRGYDLQTGGSARRSFIKNTDDTYFIHGVPGHTHNASAMSSVTAEYSRKRGIVRTIGTAWANEPVVMAAEDYTCLLYTSDAADE